MTEAETVRGLQAKEHQELMTVARSKERDMEQTLLQSPPEGTKPTDTLILDSQPPELQDNKFLLFYATQCPHKRTPPPEPCSLASGSTPLLALRSWPIGDQHVQLRIQTSCHQPGAAF